MAPSLETFIRLLESSGILSTDTLNEFFPPKANLQSAEELAHALVYKKTLTVFQMGEISKGNGKSLILGNYVLLEKIAADGMGLVFKAEHRRMKRVVAVKTLL